MAVIGVIGAGVMGADIALTCAAFGHRVVLKDVDAAPLRRVEQGLGQSLRGYRMLGAGLPNWNAAEIAANISFTLDAAALAEVDWVIENVPEDIDVKRAVYRELRQVCRPDTYYAVNTSCIPITKLAALMPQPERVVGAHFMNPVPLKKLVEVVQGYHTSEQTLRQAELLLASVGKKAVVVKDFPGFVANRLSHLFMNEAAFLVQDGVAKPAQVDAIFRDGYGHKMGPLETADLIGLDTVMRSLDVLYVHYQDPKFRCCPLLRQMVDAGVLGKKSGKGFYEYRD
jgi:3-hydroxybutyryl-CoA dehydrogenase